MIYLVRQGQTDWNLFQRFNGVTETFLNQTGIEQARKQADELKNIKFDMCFCSPQIRAVQTGEIIYKGRMILDERLSEIVCGEFEGTEENGESMKQFLQAIKTGDKGTELFEQFMKRNESFCNAQRGIQAKKHIGNYTCRQCESDKLFSERKAGKI